MLQSGFDTMNLGWFIVPIEELQVRISKLRCTSVSEDFFILTNSADPDEMPCYVVFHLGLHCLPNYLLMVSSVQSVKAE